MSSKIHIAKSAGIIGFATVISRILGFIRDIVIAKFFGTAKFAQAFVVAFRIPNMLRDLVGEGATNAAFVPVLSEYMVKKKEEFWELSNIILNLLLIILSAITTLGIIFSPFIIRFIAPGFLQDPEKFLVTVKLTRIIFPYILLIGLSAYAMGILNSLKHFSAPAFAPCLLNLAIIICATLWGESVMGLASGVLIGGVLQLAIQIPVLIKKGFRFSIIRRFSDNSGKVYFNADSRKSNADLRRFSDETNLRKSACNLRKSAFRKVFQRSLSHPAAKRIGVLLVPRILGSCVYQLSLFINTVLASLSNIVGEGGVAALYYANRVFQFPLAIFGIAIAQAALPTMSTQALEIDLKNLKETLSFSLRSVFLIMVPASLGLIILSHPIVKTLFERGRFDAYSTEITARSLAFYSIGLLSFAGIKILVSCFYSLQDTLTPVKVASFSLIVNIALNLTLMWPFKIGGLALATSISGIVNFFILWWVLRKKIGRLDGKRILISFLKVIGAALLMAGIAYLLYIKGINIFVIISVSIFTYILFAILFDVSEAKRLVGWILKRS